MPTPTPTTTHRPSRPTLLILATLTAALVAALALTLGGIPSADASQRATAAHPRRHACRDVAQNAARTQQTLDDLVAAATLDQAQADAVATALAENAPARAGRCLDRLDQRAETIDDIATLLDLTPDQIRDRLAAGESLAEIAAAQNVDRATLVATLQGAVSERLDQAVADDRITETRRADMEERAFSAIDRLVDHHRGDPLRLDASDTTPSPIPTPATSTRLDPNA